MFYSARARFASQPTSSSTYAGVPAGVGAVIGTATGSAMHQVAAVPLGQDISPDPLQTGDFDGPLSLGPASQPPQPLFDCRLLTFHVDNWRRSFGVRGPDGSAGGGSVTVAEPPADGQQTFNQKSTWARKHPGGAMRCNHPTTMLHLFVRCTAMQVDTSATQTPDIKAAAPIVEMKSEQPTIE